LWGQPQGLLYNDLAADERIKVYDRGITVSHEAEARRGVLIGYRTGDVWSPRMRARNRCKPWSAISPGASVTAPRR